MQRLNMQLASHSRIVAVQADNMPAPLQSVNSITHATQDLRRLSAGLQKNSLPLKYPAAQWLLFQSNDNAAPFFSSAID